MKEIKFRIWDKENKKMINLGRIDIADGSCSPTIFGNIFYDYWNDVELMQYIGVKDKNGREIYEGDIVKFFEYKVINSIVLQEEIVIIKDIRVGCDTLRPSQYMEVIGNIYENPELIINE